MEVADLSDDQLHELYSKVLLEKKRRKRTQKDTEIRNHIKNRGFYIGYFTSYHEIDGLQRYTLNISVLLKANSRSKYKDEIDEDSYAVDFAELPEWLQWLDGYLPQIKKDEFERTSDWEAGDWDDPLRSKGSTELTIWYQYYDALCGLCIDLEQERKIFFIKANESYRCYLPIGEAPSDVIEDVCQEEVGVWWYDGNISQKDTLIIAGQIFKYEENFTLNPCYLVPL